MNADVPPRRSGRRRVRSGGPGGRSGGLRRLRRILRRRAPRLVGRLAGPWRRSLQVRVVTITLLVSSVLVLAFGYFVARQITAGLVIDRRQAAVSQVRSGADQVRQQFSALSGTNDPHLGVTMREVVVELANRAGDYDVLLVPENGSIQTPPYGAPSDADEITISPELSATVHRQTLAYQFVSINPHGGARKPYLAVGERVDVGWSAFDVYYLFPLDDQVDAADLVRNTMIIAGLALVLLLALIAAIVTRMVVTPVRAAASTAQRLSAGLLHERMEVRGEDDLARLAASFNQMASNLQNQIMRLEELSRLQRRFTSDVSHELRTPLTTVRMAADLLYASRSEFPPATARSAELLADELDRFETLLTDLLEISRFDAGFAVLDSEPVDLVPIVEGVVAGFAVLSDRLHCPVEVALPDEPVIAEVDPRRVERVLRNLVGNAIEHGENRPVTVRVASAEHAVAVAVRDRGIGLKPGEEKLVFNRFWRADPSRARQTGGSGLGLSISLEDARLHGGWLEAWGAAGEGSQFRLTLPARAGDRLLSSPLPLVPADAWVPGAENTPARGAPAASSAGRRTDGSGGAGGNAGDVGSGDGEDVAEDASARVAGPADRPTDADEAARDDALPERGTA